MYADFNRLTLEITLEALFGFTVDRVSDNDSGRAATAPTSSSERMQAQAIVAAVAKAFEFFTRRAGSAFVLPEWVSTGMHACKREFVRLFAFARDLKQIWCFKAVVTTV